MVSRQPWSSSAFSDSLDRDASETPNVRYGWKADVSRAVIEPVLRASSLIPLICSAAIVAGCDKGQPPKPHAAVYDAARCSGVPRNWSKKGSEFYELTFISRLAVGPNRLKWNGQSVTSEAVRTSLVKQREMTPISNVQVVFQVGTDCRLVQETRKAVDTSFRCDDKHRCIEYTDAELARFLLPPPTA
jgi:hypothetical protein